MAGRQEAIGPFAVRASLHETIWGGRRLGALAGKSLPEDIRIGESWETALDSVVVTPPHEGETLGALVETYGETLLGSRAVGIYGVRFPLLAKFLDANDWLSVQAHPGDVYAAAHEGDKLGKTEAWYILAAEPGSKIVYGLAHEAPREAVSAAIAANQLEPLLRTVEVHAGDIVFVPAGTIHAIGSGIALYELQEYSDITYRLYDYGRLQANGQPRELHVERALDVIRYTPAPTVTVAPTTLSALPGAPVRKTLVACHYFVEKEIHLDGALVEPAMPSSCRIVTVLSGEAEVVADEYAPLRLRLGDTAVLPASLGEATIRGEATFIRSYVPEPDDEALELWRRAHAGMFPED